MRPWMGGVIYLGQVLKIQPRVHLGGADVGMTQQLLDRTQVTTGLQHMAGKGMPQHVRVHGRGHARLAAALLQALPD